MASLRERNTTVTKRGTDYKMAKKVAELTQVVHMLFTRNHEHEVELQTLKQLYDAELRRTLDAHEERYRSLTDQVQILQDKYSTASSEDALRAHFEKELKLRDDEWARKLDAKEHQSAGNRHEVQHLRDLLISAQRDIELLRKGLAENAETKTAELLQKDKEIERLTKLFGAAERKAKDAELQGQKFHDSLAQTIKQLESELAQMKSMQDEAGTNSEVLQSKNKQFETEIRSLKKELAKRDHEIGALRRASISSTPAAFQAWESNDELDRLRKEVQRYRLELHNREGNFNRMFTSSAPVLLDIHAGAYGTERVEILKTPSSNPPHSRERRPKAISYALSQSFDDSHSSHKERNLMQRLPPMRPPTQSEKLTRVSSSTRQTPKDMLVQYSQKFMSP